MDPFLSCPKCQARLRVPAGTTPRLVRCAACGCDFAPPSDKPEALDAIPVEETRVRAAEMPALAAPPETEQPKRGAKAGCFLYVLALSPLLIPLLAGLIGLFNSFRMMRLPDPTPSGAEGTVLG